MRILIIRHADPDYSIDSLTENGWKEAGLLADRLEKIPMKACYVSPLGRAQDTANCTLGRTGLKAVTCDWLREFWPKIQRPDVTDRRTVCWDFLPQDLAQEEQFFDKEKWSQVPVMEEGQVRESYDQVIHAFDEVLASHGYVRDGLFYRAQKPNTDTIVFVCHFGMECVLLSHLLNISPMALWHGIMAAPSSVTTLHSEERREGLALFRAAAIGDTSHLYAGGREPSFAGRFCEVYSDASQRH